MTIALPAEDSSWSWREIAMVLPMLSSGALVALSYTAVSAILSELAQHVGSAGDGALTAQVFMATPSIGMMAGGLLSGWLIGRLGAKTVLLVALAVYGISGSCGLILGHIWPLLVSRLLLGFGAAASATAGTTLLAEHFAGNRRERLVGFQSSIGAAFGLLSTLAAGAVASIWGWHSPFALYMVSFALLFLSARWIPARTHASSDSTPSRTNVAASATIPWRALGPLYVLCIPLYAAVFMTSTQVPFLLWDDGVRSPLAQSFVLAMAALWNAIGAALHGRVRSGLGTSDAFALALGLMAVGQATLGLSHGPWLTGLGCAVAGCGAGLAVPHVPNALLRQVSAAARGRALGVMYTLLYLGSFCNPVFVAPLASTIGRHGALLLSGALLALGSAVVLRRTARLPAVQQGF